MERTTIGNGVRVRGILEKNERGQKRTARGGKMGERK